MDFWGKCKKFFIESKEYITGEAAQRKKDQAARIEQEAMEQFAAASESLQNQLQNTQLALEELSTQRLTISHEILPRMVDFCKKHMTVDKVNIKALMPRDVEYPQVEMENIQLEQVQVGKLLRDGAVTGLMGAATSWALGLTASTGGLAAIVLAPIAAAGLIAYNKKADKILTRAEEIAADAAIKIEKMRIIKVELQAIVLRAEELKSTTGKVVNRAEEEIQKCERCTEDLQMLACQLRNFKYKKIIASTLEVKECQKLCEQTLELFLPFKVKADKLISKKNLIIRWFCKMIHFIFYKPKLDKLKREIEFYQSVLYIRQQEQMLIDERNNHLVAIVLFIKSIHKIIRIPVLDQAGKASVKTQDEEVIRKQVS